MLDDLALFVSIVDHGSLQAAARHAGLPPATLTRRLQKLETTLGCQLLLRSARSLKPTPEGLLYYEQCRPLLTALAQTTATLDDDLNQVKGTLRVLAPLNLSRGILAPAWASFLTAWPEIRLELSLSNQNEDVWRHGADLAIRVGQQDDPKLRQRRLGMIGMALVAAPAYVAMHGAPTHPSELESHALLVSKPLSTWRFTSLDGAETVELTPSGRCGLNDIELAVTLAEAGLGLLYCPHTLCHEAIRAGRLVRVLADWRNPQRPIYAVWPQQQMPRKVRTLLEHLAAFTAATPLLQGELD
ncbi:LysR family transcriptional regulator [uncultured Ralstonia sp.]|jgi:LysR family transcriptional regulator AphB|uniref:LysR family transcriptional regulator n=1 Tax=Ralstonia sp. TaxID=54061 RepID=UPI001EAA894D|nr:LysR family transcriptional regulator [uncultured Ralstonia sp.]UCF23536.1 MAG: LysR family transcriptional regulator [Ralstonia sp.]